jgi:predicted DCC family thiol-disulfide oxidoreductase YuxK
MPPGRFVILYDGHCRFCTAGSRRLAAWMRGAVEQADFQRPGVLERFPGLTHEKCMERLHLVAPDGRVFAGAEAIARAIATRPLLGKLAFLYFVPGLRQLIDVIYKLVAAHRYRIAGRSVAASECAGGTCAVHFPPKRTSPD